MVWTLVKIPTEILLELGDIVDLPLDDFKSLRLVHPNLGQIFAPKVLRNVSVPLSTLFNDTDRSENSIVQRRERESGQTNGGNHSPYPVSVVFSSRYQDHVKKLRIKATSHHHIPNHLVDYISGNDQENMNLKSLHMDRISQLLSALSSLRTVYFHVSLQVVGNRLFPVLMTRISSKIQDLGLQLELHLGGLDGIKYYKDLMESINAIHSLTIEQDILKSAYFIGVHSALIMQRSPQLTCMKFDTKEFGIPLKEILHIGYLDLDKLEGDIPDIEKSNSFLNLEVLHIDGNMLHDIHGK